LTKLAALNTRLFVLARLFETFWPAGLLARMSQGSTNRLGDTHQLLIACYLAIALEVSMLLRWTDMDRNGQTLSDAEADTFLLARFHLVSFLSYRAGEQLFEANFLIIFDRSRSLCRFERLALN